MTINEMIIISMNVNIQTTMLIILEAINFKTETTRSKTNLSLLIIEKISLQVE